MNAPDDATLRTAVPPAVGVRQPLIDGVEKVTGRALYTADLRAGGVVLRGGASALLHGLTAPPPSAPTR